MPGYTNVAKPTSSVYTGVYGTGKQIYDQADIEYDQSTVAYDSIIDGYTGIGKPTLSYGNWEGMGMQWQDASATWDSTGGWTDISKPT